MLVMSRPLMVTCTHRPTVTVDSDILRSHVDHWLDANAHSRTKQRSDTTTSVVGDIRVFMKTTTYTMTRQFTNNRVTTFLTVILYGITNVTYSITNLGLFDTDIKTLLRCSQQAENLLIDITHGKSVTAVAIETVDDRSTIASDNVAVPKFIIRRETMYNLVIDFDAEGARKAFITLETRNATVITDKLLGNLVKPKGSNTWLDPLGDFAKCLSNQLISLSNQLYFFVSLQKYHSEISISSYRTCATFDLAVLHQTVIVMHHQMRLDLLESIQNYTHKNQE